METTWEIEGWSYDDVLPYFKKAENFHGDGDEEFHGYSGPLHVKNPREKMMNYLINLSKQEDKLAFH